MKNVIETPNAPRAEEPYSQAIEANGFVFTSGVIGVNPATGELEGYDEEQTEQAMLNLENLLLAAGTSIENVVKTTVYIKNMADFKIVNDVYKRHFSAPYPARICVEVSSLPKGALVELEAVALK
jgi:2-iminobutanoate/2-iminopropanoate deaminase